MISERALIRRREEVHSAKVDEEVVMFDAEDGAYFALGVHGSRIWELLEEPRTLEELCASLQEEYDVEPERCLADVSGFVEELAESQLVDFAG